MTNLTPGINKFKKLCQFGQSPWYDNIDRRLIESGELKAIFEKGILGVTSNPTIFEKAVNSSNVYDAKIKALKSAGKTLQDIYDELTADDVRDAANMLKDVYDRTNGIDGYVSIEVLPAYAYDSLKTIEYARHIYQKVNKPNIMIKVPGTKDSLIAIRALISEGINVNVTLLFSVDQYAAIAAAYVEGISDRVSRGLDVTRVASVASVFVSRIDTKVDALMDNFASRHSEVARKKKFTDLKGKAAIANSKMVYQKFKEIFNDKSFLELKAKGAQVQRPLWASTGTKNPEYSDCLYVDNLIGLKTVNTMPHETMKAYFDHGHVALNIENALDDANRLLMSVRDAGVNLDKICEGLQAEGIGAFQASYDSLMNSLKAKAV